MARGHKTTKEEAITEKLIDILADLRTDLDMIGLYFGKYARVVIFRRLEHIYEVAKHHRDQEDDREAHYEYVRNISK